MADDRVLQVLAHSENKVHIPSAFGTGDFLLTMLEAANANAETLAADFRQLLQWRYRFLIPSPRLLFTWAKQSRNDPPGDELLDLAAYMHDCFRDPGLHCGPESAKPAIPIAAKLVGDWSDAAVTLLAMIWSSGDFNEAQALRFTTWIGQDFVPSCPRGLWMNPIGFDLVRIGRRSAVSMAVVKFAMSVKDLRRANLGLWSFAESLGMSRDEFDAAVAEAMHAFT